jgi:hypothetical protein
LLSRRIVKNLPGEPATRWRATLIAVRGLPRLGHLLPRFWFWRSHRAGLKFSPRSAFKPNPAQTGVLFAHAHIGGFACPLEAFFGPFPIISGCRHRFVF